MNDDHLRLSQEASTSAEDRETLTSHTHATEGSTVARVGTIELREERLFVDTQREVAGTLALTREVRRETVQVPVELVTEVLVIEHRGGPHSVSLDGDLLAVGERREIVVYREDAVVDKRVVVSEVVNVGKRLITETRTFDATLAREELVVHEEGHLRRLSDTEARDLL